MATARVTKRVKACTECRQQKLRCDAHLHSTNFCSRCRRLGIQCIISDQYHRTKRQSKAEMQRELTQLRALAESDSLQSSAAFATEKPPAMTPSSTLSGPPSVPPNSISSPMGLNRNFSPGPASLASKSQPKTLDGLELNSQKTLDCFTLYFKHYHPLIPILEPSLDPDQYYQYSPLVFWTIISIGSRRYSEDPTIIDRITSRVVAFALQMCIDTQRHIETIQSLILLCYWALPKESMYHDVSHVMGGAALQLAIQNGLHMFSKRQDFSTNSIRHDENEQSYRARLWTHCKIVCQSLNIWAGLYPFLIPDAFDLERHHQETIRALPPRVYWSHSLHKTLTKAVASLMPSTSRLEEDAQYGELQMLIDVFDNEILDIKNQANENLSILQVAVARLYIGAFEFFCRPDDDSISRLTRLYSIVSTVVRESMSLDHRDGYAQYGPYTAYLAIGLCAGIILRLARSHFELPLDHSVLERLYFSGISFIKKISLQNDDKEARCARMLTQLWPSQKIFGQPDGTVDSHKVRLRNRGAMGIIYDCYWYWAVEFKGQSDPWTPKAKPQSSPAGNESRHSAQGSSSAGSLEVLSEQGLNPFQGIDFTDGFWEFPAYFPG